jgi:hypothetical protein
LVLSLLELMQQVLNNVVNVYLEDIWFLVWNRHFVVGYFSMVCVVLARHIFIIQVYFYLGRCFGLKCWTWMQVMQLYKFSYVCVMIISIKCRGRCAKWNCYSLQKDHETKSMICTCTHPPWTWARTLSFSLRYRWHAYTLCRVLMFDARHYKSRHELRMLNLSPKSSVILSYLGTMLHILKVNILLYLTW